MTNTILKGGLVATLPIMMMLAIVPTAMPTAHANGCLATADAALTSLVPGEINTPTKNGIHNKLDKAQDKFDDGKISDTLQKIQDARDKVTTLEDRGKITDTTETTLLAIIDAFETCLFS